MRALKKIGTNFEKFREVEKPVPKSGKILKFLEKIDEKMTKFLNFFNIFRKNLECSEIVLESFEYVFGSF